MSRPLRGSERRLALLAGDAVAVSAAVVLALWTWSLTAGFPFDAGFLKSRALWFAGVPVWLIVLIPTRRSATALDLPASAAGIARSAGALLLVYLAAFFSAGGARLPRLVALYVLWDASLFLLGWRLVAQWSLTRAPFARRMLVAGSGTSLKAALDLIGSRALSDAEVTAIVTDDSPRRDSPGSRPPVYPLTTDLDALVDRWRVTDIVVAMTIEVDDVWIRRLLACQEKGTHVVRMAQLYEEALRRVPIGHVEPSWLLTSFFDVARFRETSPLAKRALDIAAACGLALVGCVLAPLIALAVILDDGSPVLYRQPRLGRAGRPFQITKFRTMKTDAEAGGAVKWSTPGDPRVTRIGRWLRRTRLDELPNLLSVLRGEMSMVGPRPERAEFVTQLERDVPFYRARLIVRPGLTGWAQVNSPYGASVEDASVKLEYDLYYIKHQSIWFDLLILTRTIGTMLRLAGR